MLVVAEPINNLSAERCNIIIVNCHYTSQIISHRHEFEFENDPSMVGFPPYSNLNFRKILN